MTDPRPSPSASTIDAVLAALDRLAGDLRRRAEEAEGRAAAAEARAALERRAREAEAEARHAAEARAAAAEQKARDAILRSKAVEAAARESVERLRRDLLDAIQEAAAAAQAAQVDATIAQTAAGFDRRRHAERSEDPHHLGQDQGLSHIPRPLAGSSQPAPRRWGKGSGYAWIEEDPGPPWWRRVLSRRRRY